MRFFRFVGYFLIILSLLLVPLYGGVRIFLPEWIKGQLASMLPDDATLKIGEISSTARMGVLYKDLVYERINTNTKIFLDHLIIEPNLNLKKPAQISIKEGFISQDQLEFKIKDLMAEVVLENFNTDNMSVFGKIKEIEGLDKSFISNLDFLVKGLTNFEKSVSAQIEDLEANFILPKGPVSVQLSSINLNTKIAEDLKVEMDAKKSMFDLSALGAGNPNRKLNSDEISLNFNLFVKDNWILPLAIDVMNLSSPLGEIGNSLKLEATGVWKNEQAFCQLKDIMNNNAKCGRMTDVIDTHLQFKQNNGNFNFSGNGYCVTPRAGCPQIIESEIKTKNTTDIISKVILSGIIDPLIGGVILGALLSDTSQGGENFDHKASIKVQGNAIFLNGKPLL